MEFNIINKKLEMAFDKTGIQKYDVCQLWAYLSCDLLYDEEHKHYAFPVIGSMCFTNKITKIHQEYLYGPKNCNSNFHMVTFYYKHGSLKLLDFSTAHLSLGTGKSQVSLPDVPVIKQVSISENIRFDLDIQTALQRIINETDEICIDNDKYFYKFEPYAIYCQPNLQNEIELEQLERVLGIS